MVWSGKHEEARDDWTRRRPNGGGGSQAWGGVARGTSASNEWGGEDNRKERNALEVARGEEVDYARRNQEDRRWPRRSEANSG